MVYLEKVNNGVLAKLSSANYQTSFEKWYPHQFASGISPFSQETNSGDAIKIEL